ncbi:MAG TPA: DHA2 family efflux MFS transporter permease subunit [Roseiflexaceae bacterium]|nr:DHA2 family efflux MFS transporter permease subunit [Roseiflexaceae bacterium]
MSNPAAELPPEQGGRLAYKWKVLISIVFGVFMIILDSTVVNVALQTLRREYNVSLTAAQWIISIYVLALGITTPLSGFLADRFGIKRIYVGGLALFVFGSFLCGLAPSIELLIIARALQGFGGGLAQPLGPALLYSSFPPKEQGTALGFFGIALVVAPALGPVLGGLLVDQNMWRWIFFINIPIGLVGVTLASRLLKRDEPRRKPVLDPLGIVTAVIGFGSLLYAATTAADLGWDSPGVLLWFAVGGVALVAFALIELFVAKEPLLELRLFRNPTFLTAALVGYVTVLALFGAEFLMPVYLQALRGRGALETGLILLPLALTSGITTPLAGRLYDKIGPRMIVSTGFAILLINTWQLAQIQADSSIGWIAFLLALRGLALGLIVQTSFATALASVPRALLPRGSSLVNGTRFVVQSVGVAVLATVLSSSVSPATRAFQEQAQARAEDTAQANVSTPHFGLCETPGVPADQNLPTDLRAAPAAAQTQARQSIQTACQENLIGFERAYQLTFYFALAALAISLFLPGWPLRWAGRGSLGSEQPAPAAGH